MFEIVSMGYFIRDLTVLLLVGSVVILLAVMERGIKSNLGHTYFIKVFDTFMLAFVLVVIAQVIGVLLHTTLLENDPLWLEIRSVLLTIAAFFIFISAFVMYIPFARGKYMIVPIAVEPVGDVKYGGYWAKEENAHEAFLKLVKWYRFPGIAVARDPPVIFRKRLGLKLVPVMWVSKVQHDEAVSPTRLAHLLENLRRFLEATNMDKVILIDCLEYLILENGEDPVLKFITSLKDFASLNRGVLIVSLDREAVGEKVFNILTSELRPIEELEEAVRKAKPPSD